MNILKNFLQSDFILQFIEEIQIKFNKVATVVTHSKTNDNVSRRPFLWISLYHIFRNGIPFNVSRDIRTI